jgi:hypothetical protein
MTQTLVLPDLTASRLAAVAAVFGCALPDNGLDVRRGLRRAPQRSTATPARALARHGRRLLGLIARAQPDASGWTSEAQLESMVPGGRLEWRVLALEALTAAGLLDRVQRDGQFDYRLTRKGLEAGRCSQSAQLTAGRRGVVAFMSANQTSARAEGGLIARGAAPEAIDA